MDRVRVGQIFRALRREQNLRQADLAGRAGVAQQTVSEVECGRFGRLTVDAYCHLAETLGADVDLAPRWRGPKLARLLDRRHAALCDAVARELVALGWEIRTETTFNHFGDRGSVDLLAWRADVRALLIVEIKTELVSIEETLRTLDMKTRVVPMVAARDLGWAAVRVDPEMGAYADAGEAGREGGRLGGRRRTGAGRDAATRASTVASAVTRLGVVLVLPEGSTQRDLVARHRALLGASLPARNVEVKRWLREPATTLRGILFFRNTTRDGAMETASPRQRIRKGSKVSETGAEGPRAGFDGSLPRRRGSLPGGEGSEGCHNGSETGFPRDGRARTLETRTLERDLAAKLQRPTSAIGAGERRVPTLHHPQL